MISVARSTSRSLSTQLKIGAALIMALAAASPAQAAFINDVGMNGVDNPSGAGGNGQSVSATNALTESSSQAEFGGNGGSGGAGAGGNGGAALSNLAVTASGPVDVISSAYGGNGGQGNGGAGGIGGTANATASGVSTDGGDVYVNAFQKGGSGGASGLGQGGANSFMTNAVSGYTTGRLTLAQTSQGGNGGYSTSGNGAAGGNAVSSLSVEDSAASYLYVNANAQGGDGGGSVGNGHTGGAAGTATATARGVSTIGSEVYVYAQQQGGNGGYGDGDAKGGDGADSIMNNAVSGRTSGTLTLEQMASGGGANGSANNWGGNGGQAFSDLKVVDDTAHVLTVRSNAVGGYGGESYSSSGGYDGAISGHGGAAYATASATSTIGADVNVSAIQRGGNGGYISQGAIGGYAADSTMINAVSGYTTGNLTLSQQAYGGSSYGAGAGSAFSQLGISDNIARALTVNSLAQGGENYYDVQRGGNATSLLTINDAAADNINGTSTAYGSNYLYGGLAGGTAHASTDISSKTASYIEGHSTAFSATEALATTNVASAVNGANVRAYATAFGPVGHSVASAHSQSVGTNSWAYSLAYSFGAWGETTASSQMTDDNGNRVSTSANTKVNSPYYNYYYTANTVAGDHGWFGSTGLVGNNVGGAVDVYDVTSLAGVNGNFHVIGSGVFGTQNDVGGGASTYTGNADYSFSLGGSTREMYLGFSGLDMTGAGFDSATLKITKNNSVFLDQTFTDTASLFALLNSGLMDLGSATGQVSLSISLVQMLSGIANGAGFSYQVALAQVPLPPALVMFATGLLLMLLTAHRRKERAGA